jgi:predicted transcriptional regulator of viral defense system
MPGVPKLYERLTDRPVFTTEEAIQATQQTEEQVFTQLSYLVGQRGQEVRVHPHVLASKLAPRYQYGEYVLLYHAALELHGLAQSRFNEVYVGSEQPFKRLEYQGVSYIHTHLDRQVVDKCAQSFQVEGQSVRASDREWTFAFTVMHPNMAGGLEETLRSLNGFAFIDAARLLEIGRLFKPACYYNRVGFVLSLFDQKWDVPDDVLAQFKDRARRTTDSYATGDGPTETIPEFNIRVPAKARRILEA